MKKILAFTSLLMVSAGLMAAPVEPQPAPMQHQHAVKMQPGKAKPHQAREPLRKKAKPAPQMAHKKRLDKPAKHLKKAPPKRHIRPVAPPPAPKP